MSGNEEGWPSGEAVPDGDNYMTESAEESIPDSADSKPGPSPGAFTPEEWAEITGNSPDSADHQTMEVGADSRLRLICPNCKKIGLSGHSNEGAIEWEPEPSEVGPELVDCGAENCVGHLVGEGGKCLTSKDLYEDG